MRQAHFVYCTNVNSQNKISRLQEITGNQLKNFGSIIAPLCASAINSGAVSSKPSRACAICAEEMGIEVNAARLCTNRAGHEYFNLSFKIILTSIYLMLIFYHYDRKIKRYNLVKK